ncbi:MAG: glycerol-3-phosphate dehydrogenase [Micrococcales bacterium]
MAVSKKAPARQTEYDVVVIGAGINGLGIARDSAERGLKTLLVEQADLCAGVSAWSGRLVHGGLRYLEHMDLALVRESLKERERLFKLAPHLVKPVWLIMPFYKKNRRPSWMIWMGMMAYDALSLDKSVSFHRIASKTKVTDRFKGMSQQGLGGAALFIDGQVEYAERLCVEIALAAKQAGCDINIHTKAVGFEVSGATMTGVKLQNSAGETYTVKAKAILNAGGPWVDRVNEPLKQLEKERYMGGTKGSHIIVDSFPGAPSDVVYYESQADGRLVLVIPWMGRYLIGTTDTKYDEEPDSARADNSEVEYLLSEVNTLIPGANLKRSDILYTYSGVRPLPYAPGVSEWKVPRSHIVKDHAVEGLAGFYSIIGGKLTTYRQLAEDAVDLILKNSFGKKVATKTKNVMFPGAQETDFAALKQSLVSNSKLQAETVDRLVALYGSRARLIVDLVAKQPELAERFDPKSAAIAAELVLAVREEFAETMTDVFARRILLAFEPGHGLEATKRAADILGELLGWSAVEKRKNIAEYVEWLDHLKVPAL